jgi:hypothetical protein
MAQKYQETLKTNNFLSIKHLDWEFADFNIISGDMAAGKSLCLKIVKFFQDIVPDLLMLPYNRFIMSLNASYYFNYLTEKFINTFYLGPYRTKQSNFTISYKFSCEGASFAITVKRLDKTNIIVESPFLETLLKKWHDRLKKKGGLDPDTITLDGIREVKHIFYCELQKEFNDYFPLKTVFIPASREALALTSDFSDQYLRNYHELMESLPVRKNLNPDEVNHILKAKVTIEDMVYLESEYVGKVPLALASSGQQSIVNLLLLLDRMGSYRYAYGKDQSLFIEEPDVYLSPPGQKQMIEFIVKTYNRLKKTPDRSRFFITTCSAYVMDSMNNMLLKGELLKKSPKLEKKIDKEVKIPGLCADDVRAYYLNNGGCEETLLKNNQLAYPPEIGKTSSTLQDETKRLRRLFR